MKEKHYNKEQLLRVYDDAVKRGSRALVDRFGRDRAEAIQDESRVEYEALIPGIPYIGPRTPMLVFLLPASWYLAVYRVLRKKGLGVEEAGRAIYHMNEAELKAIPCIGRRLIGYLWFSGWFAKKIKRRAEESQRREYPGNYVFSFVEGDGRTFDYGVNYTECAACKFLRNQGAPELLPVICACDQLAGDLLHWGLTRTKTLAEGADKCDFRFKRGDRTNVGPMPF